MCFNTIYKIPSCFRHLYISSMYQVLLSGGYSKVKIVIVLKLSKPKKKYRQVSRQVSLYYCMH